MAVQKLHDIVIIGGGVAGLSLAASLSHSPLTKHLSIALIEANALPSFTSDSPISNRTSSLTRVSVRYLQRSTAWDRVLLDRTQAYRHMHVYDGISDQQIQFEQSQGIATMVENYNLQSALVKALKDTKVTFHIARVDTISEPTMQTAYPSLRLSNHETISAKLLVGADGANSPVRAYAKVNSYGWDYPHHGIVGTLTHTKEDHTTAHQRMLPSGPIAFLPLPHNKASMVWSIHPRHASILKSLDTATMTRFINAAFRLSPLDLTYIMNLPVDEMSSELDWRLSLPSFSRHAPPEVLAIENVASFPLRFRHADTYHAERIALIGDAAHTIHPLAGQGLNLALLDSASLQGALEKCVELGGDIGMVGEQVSRDRYWANARVSGTVDKIHKLYATEASSIVGLRSFGSGLLDKLEVAKRALMSSMG